MKRRVSSTSLFLRSTATIAMLVVMLLTAPRLPRGAMVTALSDSPILRWSPRTLPWNLPRIPSDAKGREMSWGTRLWSSLESGSNNSKKGRLADDALAIYRNPKNREDQVFSALSRDGGIKVTAVTCRNLMNDLMMQQTLSPVSADCLGRTIICSVLLANGMQDKQLMQITMNGDGPIRGIVAITTGNGHVRGYVGSPMLGDMPLQDAVGQGSVQIVKNHPDWPRPYNGITAIRHGDIDRDIGIYLADSEQRSCALAAATSINGVLCTAAGGYLIEQLPGVEKHEVEIVERNLAKLVDLDGGDRLPTNLLLSGQTPLDLASLILDGLDFQPLQQIQPKLVCECTEDRLFRSIRLLPRDDVEDILEKNEVLEARCQFCGKVYRMQPDELRKRLDSATGDPSRD